MSPSSLQPSLTSMCNVAAVPASMHFFFFLIQYNFDDGNVIEVTTKNNIS